MDVKSTGLMPLASRYIVCDLGYSPGGSDESTPLLGDLDETYLNFLVSKEAAETICRIRVYANEFLLGSYGPDDISVTPAKNSAFGKMMSEKGQAKEIMMIRPKTASCFALNFRSRVPLRRYLPQVVQDVPAAG